ncbi:MAG: deoxyribonuclease V [Acidobacteriota bacterium]
MLVRMLHPWKVSPQQARAIQNSLSKKVIQNWDNRHVRTIAGADVSFPDSDTVLAAVVIVTYPNMKVIETRLRSGKCEFPYIPGLLAFREVPALISVLEELKSEPDILMCDAQGIAHPRGMGLATHIGILTDKPSIGCAKSCLYGKYDEPGDRKGDFSYLTNNSGERIGAVLRTRDGVQPVFVSVGHRIDLNKSIDIVLACSLKFRIPEPLRLAHKLAAGEKIEMEGEKESPQLTLF